MAFSAVLSALISVLLCFSFSVFCGCVQEVFGGVIFWLFLLLLVPLHVLGLSCGRALVVFARGRVGSMPQCVFLVCVCVCACSVISFLSNFQVGQFGSCGLRSIADRAVLYVSRP